MAYTVNKTIKRFKDLNLSFTRHPITADVTVKTDVEAIKFAIRNLLMTKKYEVPFHPEIGSSLIGQLFENYTVAMKNIVTQEIGNVILNSEPRAELLDVLYQGVPHENRLNVVIVFRIINISEPITLNLLLERTR